MQFAINHLLIVILLIGLIKSEVHTVCEVCTCDDLDKPIIVHCDSKKLSTLTNITFNASIETLSFINNSLTLKSTEDLEKLNNITSLKTLVLTDNPLSTIPELSLPNLVNLQLENTYLKNATFPKSFENCTNLQSVVLSNNTLTTITSDTFKSLPSLTKVSIDNAQLNTIEADTFTNMSNSLQSISLVSNSLKSAEFFSSMTNLLSINLDKNQFQQLPTEMIKPGRTKHFFFRDNQIDTINESSPLFYWTQTNLTGMEIYLNNNPFNCCQSQWFIHHLQESNNLVRDASELICASPKAYTGRRLIDLHADLMDCSSGPIHPPKPHLTKIVMIISCLLGVVLFILVVVGVTLYRRNRLPFRRRHAYEPIQGDDLLA